MVPSLSTGRSISGSEYESNGAAWSPTQPNGTGSFVNKQAYGSKWLWSPNNLSQSVVGIKMSQPLPFLSGPFLSGWSLVGTAESGFQTLSWNLANGARSQAQNNGKAQLLQGFNADSGRDGEWDNSQGFIGLSNPAYGTLVWGRVNTLGLDGLVAYDVMSSAYAFSPFGFSGSYAGFGDTELTRSETALKYNWNSQNLVSWMNFRVAGIAQTGSYNQGNPSTEFWQGQIGADFPHLFAGNSFAGTLSADFIGGYAQNAVNLSNFTGTCTVIKSGLYKGQTACTSGIPKFYDGGDLKATLSNNVGTFLLGKYKFDQFPLTVSGGWEHWKQSDPSSTFPNGFQSIAGYSVPGTITGNKLFPTTWISYTTYADNRIVNVFFLGAKYAVTPQVDVSAAYYYLEQNNYNSSTTPCAYANATFTPPNGHTFVVIARQQRRLRGLARRLLLPDRLSAGQAHGPLRRPDGLERLWRPRERLPRHPGNRPDGRPAHQVLTRYSRGRDRLAQDAPATFFVGAVSCRAGARRLDASSAPGFSNVEAAAGLVGDQNIGIVDERRPVSRKRWNLRGRARIISGGAIAARRAA